MNFFKTALLLVVLAILLIYIGGIIGGPRGAMIAFIFAIILNGVSYWYSDKIVLKMYRAKEMSKEAYPRIYRMVEDLCREAELPMPRICTADLKTPNAFATGRDPQNAALCLTSGIMGVLDEEELRCVISHELGHIKNRDTLIMSVVAAMASAIMMLAYMARWAAILGGFSRDRQGSGNIVGIIAISILGPLAAIIVQMAISRSREYAADAYGAKISEDPMGLARALQDISHYSGRTREKIAPQTSHLFIVNPLSGNFLSNLFSTHPPLEDRVKRLKGMV